MESGYLRLSGGDTRGKGGSDVTGDFSTGRTEAKNLNEQLAMDEAKSNPAAGTPLPLVMGDSRWPAADGCEKMSQNIEGTEIHYVYNTRTGASADFKYAGGG